MDWISKVATVLNGNWPTESNVRSAIESCMPEPPLLQCPDCHNTESCAGAMARQFNRGRCMHCGGYFKVVSA